MFLVTLDMHGYIYMHGIVTRFQFPDDFKCIKTHDSESRGQEEAGRTRRTSRLTIVSREAKKKQAVRDEQVSYLHVAPH